MITPGLRSLWVRERVDIYGNVSGIAMGNGEGWNSTTHVYRYCTTRNIRLDYLRKSRDESSLWFIVKLKREPKPFKQRETAISRKLEKLFVDLLSGYRLDTMSRKMSPRNGTSFATNTIITLLIYGVKLCNDFFLLKGGIFNWVALYGHTSDLVNYF